MGEMLRRKGYHVKVFEEKINPVKLSQLKDADLIGISIQTITANRGYELAYQIRKRLKIPVVIGGVHATLNTEEALKWADFVIRNEGEYAMMELVEAFEEGGGFDEILGLSYRSGGEKYINPQRPFIKNLDEVPYPNWGLIENMNRSLSTPLNYFLHITQVSRGCPFNCTFCSITPTFGKPFRYRSIDNVIDEMKNKRKPHRDFVMYYDDNFVANRKYAKELMSAMIDNDCVPSAWHSQMRADASEDEELMELLEATNCTIATFGFESINPKTLKNLQKGQDINLIESCIEKFHDRGVFVNGFFVFGGPDDTVETVRQTAQFAIDKNIDFVGFMPLTPFPGTPFFKEIENQIFSQNWELYDVQHVVYYPKQMTPLELYQESLNAYAKFYRPGLRHFKRKKGAGIFNLIFYLWPMRAKFLNWKEKMANRNYIKYLNSLPPFDPDKKIPIPEFSFEDDRPILHNLLSNKYLRSFFAKISGKKQVQDYYPVVPQTIKN